MTEMGLRLVSEPDPIAEAITKAESRGQIVSERVRILMRIWASRNAKLPNTGASKGLNPKGLTCIELGVLPIPCDCAVCGESAVIFPPEDGYPENGYCVCPKCSYQRVAAVAP